MSHLAQISCLRDRLSRQGVDLDVLEAATVLQKVKDACLPLWTHGRDVLIRARDASSNEITTAALQLAEAIIFRVQWRDGRCPGVREALSMLTERCDGRLAPRFVRDAAGDAGDPDIRGLAADLASLVPGAEISASGLALTAEAARLMDDVMEDAWICVSAAVEDLGLTLPDRDAPCFSFASVSFTTAKQAKVLAKTLRDELSKRGVEVSHSFCVETVAEICGAGDWNRLAARLKG